MATSANQETIRYAVVPPVTLSSFNKFSGEAHEDLQSFLSQFQHVAFLSGWSEQMLVAYVSTYLAGRARSVINGLPNRPSTAAELESVLSQYFSPVLGIQAVFSEFMKKATQGSRDMETLEYVYTMRKLSSRAGVPLALALSGTIQGLPKKLQEFFWQQEPKSFEELIKNIVTMTSRGVLFRENTGTPMDVEVSFNVQKGKDKFRGKKICYYCKKPGHFIAECRKRLRNNNAAHSSQKKNQWYQPKQAYMAKEASHHDVSESPNLLSESEEICFNIQESKKKSQLMYLKVSIQKKPLLAVIDSGSTVSLMSLNVAKKLHVKINPLLAISLQTAAGLKEKTRGCIRKLPIQFEGQGATIDCHVVGGVPYDLILGNDFLIKNKAKLDFKSKQIELNGRKCTLIDATSIKYEDVFTVNHVGQPLPCHAKCRMILKANSVTLVPVKTYSTLRTDCIFEMTPFRFDDIGIRAARTIFSGTSDQMQLKIINTSDLESNIIVRM